MSAPVKTITTKSGHIVALKEYLTGRERRAINAVIFQNVNVSMEGTNPKIGDIPASISGLIEDETIKQTVVSVDGITENVLDVLLDLPEGDFEEVTTAIQTIAQNEEKKTA